MTVQRRTTPLVAALAVSLLAVLLVAAPVLAQSYPPPPVTEEDVLGEDALGEDVTEDEAEVEDRVLEREEDGEEVEPAEVLDAVAERDDQLAVTGSDLLLLGALAVALLLAGGLALLRSRRRAAER